MHLWILFCCWLYMLTQGNAATTGRYDYEMARSIEIHNQGYEAKQSEDLQQGIPDEPQFAEHPSGGQSSHLLPKISLKNTENNEQKLVIQLPSSPFPVHHLHPQYKVPLRKHYKIILVRNPPAATTPPPPVTPEVEEKTLIYVLVEKADDTKAQVQELQRAQQDAFKLNKPEVYFINYQMHNDRQVAAETTDNTSANTQNQQTATSLDEFNGRQVDSENHKDAGYP